MLKVKVMEERLKKYNERLVKKGGDAAEMWIMELRSKKLNESIKNKKRWMKESCNKRESKWSDRNANNGKEVTEMKAEKNQMWQKKWKEIKW